jgi:hypothetical protein
VSTAGNPGLPERLHEPCLAGKALTEDRAGDYKRAQPVLPVGLPGGLRPGLTAAS